MQDPYVPSRVTLTRTQGFSRRVSLALREAAEETGRDPRELATEMLVESLQRRGYLDGEGRVVLVRCAVDGAA